jgi:glycosyltransferase involved in cell wall biosynthesis
MNYSIIVPFYNESLNIKNLHDELTELINKSLNGQRKFELIYVDDGSTDDTFLRLDNLKKKNFDLKLIKNNKNLSQSIALYNGINNSKFDNLIFLDGDGQNDPNDIARMLLEFEKGNDLVHGYRKNRKDNFFTKKVPSIIANHIVRMISNSKIIDHGCTLKIIKKKFLDNKILWGDFHRLLAARVNSEKLKIVQFETNHRARKHGESNYGFSRIFKIFIDLIYLNLFHKSKTRNFYFIGFLGLISLALSFISVTYMLILKIFKDVSFIETPLPILSVLFTISFLIFFALLFVSHLITILENNNTSKKDDFEIFEK